MAVHLYTWLGETPWRIYGPPAGESGRWYCTCPRGMEHLGPRDKETGEKPPRCRHLANLWEHANEGELSGRFRATNEGEAKADAGCACNDGKPLIRLPPPEKPPAGPKAGEPPRNRPCTCGSGQIYKWCHGRPEEQIKALVDVWSLDKRLEELRAKDEREAAKRAARRRVPVIQAEDKAAAKRAAQRKAAEERDARLDAGIKNAWIADEARRAARRKRDAKKKGAAKG